MTKEILILEAQIRECYGRVVYSHKTQEKCADIILRRHNRLKFAQIALSAVVTTSLLVIIFGDNRWASVVGAVLSTISFGLSMYSKDYDLGEIAQKHTNAANDLWKIRETYLSLLTDIRVGKADVDGIISLRDELQERLSNVYAGSPRTNSAAYQEASKALKVKQELTFSDEEINNFLPADLRK